MALSSHLWLLVVVACAAATPWATDLAGRLNLVILCGNIIVNAYTYFYLKDIVYSFKIYPGENFLVLICNPRSRMWQLDGAGLLNWIESNRKWLVSAWPDVQYPMSSKESFSSLICSLTFLPLDQYNLNGTSVLKIPLSCRFCFYTFNNITRLQSVTLCFLCLGMLSYAMGLLHSRLSVSCHMI